jgi:carboxylesterase type B
VIPRAFDTTSKCLPVFVYVNGGSLLYGGTNHPIFDAVNLVSRCIEIELPIICVNFNYRIGIGRFPAGEAVARELKQDGYAGCGNFGFTDQKVAFDWVPKYIGYLGGDPEMVTALGESAGGISIRNQL